MMRWKAHHKLPLLVVLFSSLYLGCVNKSGQLAGDPVSTIDSSASGRNQPSSGGQMVNAESFGGGGAAELAMAIPRKNLLDTTSSLVAGNESSTLCEPSCGPSKCGDLSDSSFKALEDMPLIKRQLVRTFILENLSSFQEQLKASAFEFSHKPLVAQDSGVLARAPLGGGGPIVFYIMGILAATPRERLRLLAHEIGHTIIPKGATDPTTDTQSTAIFSGEGGGRTLLDTLGICLDWQTQLRSQFFAAVTNTLVMGSGESGRGRVRVFQKDGSLTHDFDAYPQGNMDPTLLLAAIDLDNDNVPEIITAPYGIDPPKLRLFKGGSRDSETSSGPQPFDSPLNNLQVLWSVSSTRLTDLAVGDVNGDRSADVILARSLGPSENNFIRVYSGADGSLLYNFDPFFGEVGHGTFHVAAADFSGDGIADIVFTGVLGNSEDGNFHLPEVRVFLGASHEAQQPDRPRLLPGPLGRFHPWGDDTTQHTVLGLLAATGDVNGDGRADIILAEETGTPRVKVISGRDGAELYDFLVEPDRSAAFTETPAGNVTRISTVDVNFDGVADIVTFTAAGGSFPRLQIWLGGTYDPLTRNKPIRFSGLLGNFSQFPGVVPVHSSIAGWAK